MARGADVARGVDVAHGIRMDATRHARPRGRAARALREAQVAHRARTRCRGPHGPRGHL